MAQASFRFEDFLLDCGDRRLRRNGAPVELNSRYFDALALLVRERGKLVSKNRFLDEVWRGVPVTDEALTQCIRTLRRQLGDDAGRPRFIETVPKHGYRFIAPVTGESETATARRGFVGRDFLVLGGAGTAGAAMAGLAGGLIYGLVGASQDGAGAMSVLLVLVLLCVIVATSGGAGVSFGTAAAGFADRRRALWSVAGGAAGGFIVGAAVKLIGLDAFTLLVGRSPGDITGAGEGALLGASVGLAAWIASLDRVSLRRGIVVGALLGGMAGMLASLLGGRMMAGSLDLVATRFPESRLSLRDIGAMFGETGLGPHSLLVTGALEGALFGACVVGAMTFARARL